MPSKPSMDEIQMCCVYRHRVFAGRVPANFLAVFKVDFSAVKKSQKLSSRLHPHAFLFHFRKCCGSDCQSDKIIKNESNKQGYTQEIAGILVGRG